MIIIKLESEVRKDKKNMKIKNRNKNRSSYSKLKKILVPKEMTLSAFRKQYHPVLSTSEKDMLMRLGIDPWSIEGLKYAGDCKKIKLNKK